MTDTPTKDDIRHFIALVQALSGYEAMQYTVRGHGLFSREKGNDITDAVFVRVLNWLAEKAE